MTTSPDDLRASEQRYRLLAHLGHLISSSLDLREVFRRAADEVRGLDGWDLALLEQLSSAFAIALDNAAAYEQIATLKARLERENVYLRDEVSASSELNQLIGDSPAMRQVRQAIEQVAPTDSTVLILG